MGAQASGIAFIPGLPRIAELQAGHIPHPVQIMVPEACASPKPPATRTDLVAVNSVNCIAEGQKYKLPAGYDCTPLRQVAEAICEAARDYYLVVTDQTHDKVIVRLEGAKPGQESPYYKVGGLFGCDGLQGGRPANGNEYDCWPTAAGEFHGFPWAALVAVN